MARLCRFVSSSSASLSLVRSRFFCSKASTVPFFLLSFDYGLIHADLLSENMLRDGDRVFLIDFDDGGWGFRDFELATFLLRFEEAPDYADLRAALIEGYAARRAVRADELDLFVLLRALTYPGWIADRLGEPGAQERSERAIATATRSAWRWLETYGGNP